MYPEYEDSLIEHVCKNYWDHNVKYIANMIRQIRYFSSIPLNILMDLIFNLEDMVYEEGQDVLLADTETIEAIYLVEKG